jgi:hypothetical protein
MHLVEKTQLQAEDSNTDDLKYPQILTRFPKLLHHGVIKGSSDYTTTSR